MSEYYYVPLGTYLVAQIVLQHVQEHAGYNVLGKCGWGMERYRALVFLPGGSEEWAAEQREVSGGWEIRHVKWLNL